LCNVIEGDFMEVYFRSKPDFRTVTLVAAAQAGVKQITELLGTVEPRTAQVESFETAVTAYLGEWLVSAAGLAEALVADNPALITESSTAWNTRREELLVEIWRKVPEVLGVPSLEQAMATALASLAATDAEQAGDSEVLRGPDGSTATNEVYGQGW
jgi:hypothetical protein